MCIRDRTESYLQSQGVENFRIYIAPNKETIYPQYMPESIKVYGENGSRIERFAEYMAEFSAVDFNYLYGLLKPYSEQYQIYYKYDTHVNPLGSFLISQQISAYFTGSVSYTHLYVYKRQAPCFVPGIAPYCWTG